MWDYDDSAGKCRSQICDGEKMILDVRACDVPKNWSIKDHMKSEEQMNKDLQVIFTRMALKELVEGYA